MTAIDDLGNVGSHSNHVALTIVDPAKIDWVFIFNTISLL